MLIKGTGWSWVYKIKLHYINITPVSGRVCGSGAGWSFRQHFVKSTHLFHPRTAESMKPREMCASNWPRSILTGDLTLVKSSNPKSETFNPREQVKKVKAWNVGGKYFHMNYSYVFACVFTFYTATFTGEKHFCTIFKVPRGCVGIEGGSWHSSRSVGFD